MFWGTVLQQGNTLNLASLSHQGDILHLSHLNLNHVNVKGNTTVFLIKDGQKLPLAQLNAKNHSVTLDLYFSTGDSSVFTVQGEGLVSLLGYFPPR
jgi:hypothetical protein